MRLINLGNQNVSMPHSAAAWPSMTWRPHVTQRLHGDCRSHVSEKKEFKGRRSEEEDPLPAEPGNFVTKNPRNSAAGSMWLRGHIAPRTTHGLPHSPSTQGPCATHTLFCKAGPLPESRKHRVVGTPPCLRHPLASIVLNK